LPEMGLETGGIIPVHPRSQTWPMGKENLSPSFRALHLLGKHFATWAMSPAFFASVYFSDRSSIFCSGQPLTGILLLCLPCCWDYRHEPLHPAPLYLFIHVQVRVYKMGEDSTVCVWEWGEIVLITYFIVWRRFEFSLDSISSIISSLTEWQNATPILYPDPPLKKMGTRSAPVFLWLVFPSSWTILYSPQ
jgi:hypothetical protein